MDNLSTFPSVAESLLSKIESDRAANIPFETGSGVNQLCVCLSDLYVATTHTGQKSAGLSTVYRAVST